MSDCFHVSCVLHFYRAQFQLPNAQQTFFLSLALWLLLYFLRRSKFDLPLEES